MIKKLSVFGLLLMAGLAFGVAILPGTDSVQMYVKNGHWSDTPPAVQAPVLRFTDLVSGPDTGLGDGLGSGAIVTVWGQHLGSSQGSSSIQFCDSGAVCRSGHVYYWKNANGQLPGGPANLYESHRMQEIAFSIPDSATGAGTIRVTVNSTTVTLPFTVRSGNIYHVKTGGDNANPCSFNVPCEYINGNITPGSSLALGNARLSAGDIVYSHGVLEPMFTAGDGRQNGMYLRGAAGTQAAQVAVVAYPNASNFSRVTSGMQGVRPYLSTGIVVSKYKISVGHTDPSTAPNPGSQILSDSHIAASQYGRIVANHMVQNDGMCVTGWAGAIESGSYGADNLFVLGNHIDSLGCDNSSRFQHTMYISVRDATATVSAPTVAYNYLDNNNVANGIHIYDEQYTGDCGNMTGTLRVNSNVVVNQRGLGINIMARDLSAPINYCWSANIEVDNNLLINVGQGVAADGNATFPSAMFVGGTMNAAQVSIRNNTIYGWGEDSSFNGPVFNEYGYGLSVNFTLADPAVQILNNSFVQMSNNAYIRWFNQLEPNVTTGANNFWNTVTGTGNTNPTTTGGIVADPLITITGSQAELSVSSPLLDAGGAAPFAVDIYGIPRGTTVGAVQ